MSRQAEDELQKHLIEQVGFLRSSSTAFDDGNFAEAKRLSTPIRTLLHQTPRSSALLDQLGVLTTMQFLDTAGALDAANMLPSALLTAMSMRATGPAFYSAMLGGFAPRPGRGLWLPFNQWWTTPVIKDTQGTMFSRRSLVLAVAHKDGGAHVDGLQKDYEKLSRSNSLGWVFSDQGETTPLGNPVLASLRQIADEVVESLCRAFPALTAGAK